MILKKFDSASLLAIFFTYLILLVPSLSSAYAITLSGTVTSIDSSSKFVYQTGPSKGFVPVSYNPSMVSPSGATVKSGQAVTVTGDYTSAGSINATSVKIPAPAPVSSFSISGQISSVSSTSLLIQTGAACGFMSASRNSSTQYSPSGYLPKVGDTVQISGTKNGTSSCGTSITASKVSGPSSVPNPVPAPVVTSCGAGCINYYVGKTNCSDSNTEAQARNSSTPWCSISTADSRLILGSGGTTIHVASGTYSGAITTNKAGSASARIRYISDTKYAAQLTGSSSSQTIWAVFGPYTDIVNFDFDGSVNGAVTQGILMYLSGSHSWILNNKIHDLAKNGGARNNAGGIGSCMFTGVEPTQPCANKIENNLIYHYNGGAGTGQASYGNSDGGITTGWGDIVRNNVIMDIGGGWCMQVTHTSTEVTVTNNTLISCDRGGIFVANPGSYQGGSQDYTTISNNIIVNTGLVGQTGGLNLYGSSTCGAHNIYANNLMYGNSPSNFDSSSCANTMVSTQTGSNSTTFASYTGTVTGNYHLKAGSTAIDKGTVACALGAGKCAPPTDFDGIARARGSNWDIGAYEY